MWRATRYGSLGWKNTFFRRTKNKEKCEKILKKFLKNRKNVRWFFEAQSEILKKIWTNMVIVNFKK